MAKCKIKRKGYFHCTMRTEEVECYQKRKYHGIHLQYFFHELLILFVACVVADFLDPINYILTDSEYYDTLVSYRAKCIILLVVVCIITVISLNYGCHHHYYCYGEYCHVVFHPVFLELYTHLLLPCICSYILNDWFILNLFFRLCLYLIVTIIHTLSHLWCILLYYIM